MKLLKFSTLRAIFLYSLLVFLASCKKETAYEEVSSFKKLEKIYKTELVQTATTLDQLNKEITVTEKQQKYREARKHFKMAESILAFTDSDSYTFLNQPNILKIEEEDFTDIKIKEPRGFQVIEELLFADTIDQDALKKQVTITSTRLKFLHKNQTLQFLKKHHILWILRDAIHRVALTGITGFDSPVLENSLEESQTVYQSLLVILDVFKSEFKDPSLYSQWTKQLEKDIAFLGKSNFKDLDRYVFIKNHTQETLKIWNKTVTDWKVTFPFKQPFNYQTSDLFSDKTFNLLYFTNQNGDAVTADKIALGKLLFEDSSLSKQKNMSCASCHKEALYFTDGLAKSAGATRNSPTLFYAAFQKGFFHDNRAASLEGQVVDVVNNPAEFHLSLNDLEARVKEKTVYKAAFNKAYNQEISNDLIRNAIASYIMSLSPFNSKFDLNMQGKQNTLTQSEIHGFNLFAGKAKCATCHFAPLFNGLVPTRFKESEVESIGVPKTKDTIHPEIDPDLGRYGVYKTQERKHFFKTPTIRNIAKTAPYMHNGVYTTLEEVMTFYNNGGGRGLGIDVPHQTLASDSLKLSKQEIKDLIAFMKTLTDTY
ncbi:cytochrome-c peroxidase [Flavobacterium crassostreae]|uniref:Methylamine utilization protein n=1 Tax=Flavobacterium crassostreae TaxID=1763534 RepID=A0A1B9E0J1_9FLAO|nr:cytochrome c peroxidase [Flavobacterium crassostreae]OCB75472.1 methylamine utilization protein [Flavobacterium crassostreae]